MEPPKICNVLVNELLRLGIIDRQTGNVFGAIARV